MSRLAGISPAGAGHRTNGKDPTDAALHISPAGRVNEPSGSLELALAGHLTRGASHRTIGEASNPVAMVG